MQSHTVKETTGSKRVDHEIAKHIRPRRHRTRPNRIERGGIVKRNKQLDRRNKDKQEVRLDRRADQCCIVSRIQDEMCTTTCRRIKWRTDDDNVCMYRREAAKELISARRFMLGLG